MAKADYPPDADGDALRRVRDGGSNMTKPMDIDFAVAVPDRATGEAIAERALAHGYLVRVHQGTQSMAWTCYCTRRMVPEYDAVVAAQRELDGISQPLGGHCDGWGTFGNIEELRH